MRARTIALNNAGFLWAISSFTALASPPWLHTWDFRVASAWPPSGQQADGRRSKNLLSLLGLSYPSVFKDPSSSLVKARGLSLKSSGNWRNLCLRVAEESAMLEPKAVERSLQPFPCRRHWQGPWNRQQETWVQVSILPMRHQPVSLGKQQQLKNEQIFIEESLYARHQALHTKLILNRGMLKDSELEDKTGTPESVLVSGHPSDSDIVGPWILTLRLSDLQDSEEGSRVEPHNRRCCVREE